MMDVLGSPVRRNKPYNRLVFGLSCTDVLVSLAWMASTAPIPKYDGWGPARAEGAIGNDLTCKIQGFFIQFQVMSTFYNAMLSTYYLLVIVHGWSEARIAGIQILLHGIPVATGLGLAFGGIRYYTTTTLGCHISVPPHEQSWFPWLFFVTVPSLTVTIAATVMIVRVYLKVRIQQRVRDRWRFPSQRRLCGSGGVEDLEEVHRSSRGVREVAPAAASASFRNRPLRNSTTTTTTTTTTTRLETQVFWQAVWYLAAFYITVSSHFAVTLLAGLEFETGVARANLYGLWVAHVLFAPLQGLWNSLIYFRPRLLQQSAKPRQQQQQQQQRRRRRRQQQQQQDCRRSATLQQQQQPQRRHSSTASSSANVTANAFARISGALVWTGGVTLSQNDSNRRPSETVDNSIQGTKQLVPTTSGTEPLDCCPGITEKPQNDDDEHDDLDRSGASWFVDDRFDTEQQQTEAWEADWRWHDVRKQKKLQWDGFFY